MVRILCALLVLCITACSSVPVARPREANSAQIETLESNTLVTSGADFDRFSSSERLPTSSGVSTAAVRVVDVGAGLCVVGTTDEGYSFLIDAGASALCAKAVDEMLGEMDLSLVILTHSDSDHIKALPAIVAQRHIKKLLWTGHHNLACHQKPVSKCSGTFQATAKAIGLAAQDHTTVIDLTTTDLAPGTVFKLGSLTIQFLAGWHDGPFDLEEGSELDNSVSIISKISLGASSILVMGDAIGRSIGGPLEQCVGSEEWLVDNTHQATLSSKVLIASHHGGDNGTAKCLLEKVKPTYLIFSAGNEYRHPREEVVFRATESGVQLANIFRTDRGSNEVDRNGKPDWMDGVTSRCGDRSGDDDILIALSKDDLDVQYLNPDGCPAE